MWRRRKAELLWCAAPASVLPGLLLRGASQHEPRFPVQSTFDPRSSASANPRLKRASKTPSNEEKCLGCSVKTLACVKLASFSYSTAQSTWTSIPLFPVVLSSNLRLSLVCRRARGRSLRLTHRLRRRLSPLAVSLFSPLRACGCSLRLTRRLRVAATFSLLSRGSLVDVASPRRRLHVASPRRRTYSLLSWARTPTVCIQIADLLILWSLVRWTHRL